MGKKIKTLASALLLGAIALPVIASCASAKVENVSKVPTTQIKMAKVNDTTYTLTATITPADADDQSVTWASAWTDAGASRASGKDVDDYLELSASGLTATLTLIQNFGEQITITVTSSVNSDATATCTVDYKQKINSLGFKINGSTEPIITNGTILSLTTDVNSDEVYTIAADSLTPTLTFKGIGDSQGTIRTNNISGLGDTNYYYDADGNYCHVALGSNFYGYWSNIMDGSPAFNGNSVYGIAKVDYANSRLGKVADGDDPTSTRWLTADKLRTDLRAGSLSLVYTATIDDLVETIKPSFNFVQVVSGVSLDESSIVF
jgi:hypothetical protein